MMRFLKILFLISTLLFACSFNVNDQIVKIVSFTDSRTEKIIIIQIDNVFYKIDDLGYNLTVTKEVH
jgi:hypothetical protein